MTTHTIPADHLDAARGGVLVVDGKPCPGSRTACPPLTRAMCRYGGNDHPPAEFVKLTAPCETCDGRGWLNVRINCWICAERDALGFTPPLNGCRHERVVSFRAHVLDVVPIVASDDYRVGFDRVKAYPSGEASLFRAKPSADDLRDITLPPGEHVGRYAVLIEPEES